MKRLLFFLLFFIFCIVVNAQIPYFAGTVDRGKMYAYTSVKARPGVNSIESYTSFQYGITNSFATGTDLYTSSGNAFWGLLLRYGLKVSRWYNVGMQLTPSFDLSNSFKFNYLTSGLYMNGAISTDGNLFWCSNTWLGINKGVEDTINQWTYLGYALKPTKKTSLTPMIGEIHSWRFDNDLDLACGIYYSVKKFNFYFWGNDFFKSHPRLVFGFDITL